MLLLILLTAGLSAVPAAASEDAAEAEETLDTEELTEALRQIRSSGNIVRYGMTPVAGSDVNDGVYEIESKSNSVYFRMQDAVLTAKDGILTAKFTIPSMSYLYVFMGTKAEAAKAPESARIGFEEVNGCTVFTVPVEALDRELDCAAYSKSRKKWYDRKIIFYADSLPEEALKIELPDYDLIERSILFYEANLAEAGSFVFEEIAADEPADEDPDVEILYDDEGNPLPVTVEVPDGNYSIEVNMIGGSGRASVSSPTWLTVKDGGAYATLLWSSTYYDYLILGGRTYYNQTTDGGNSTFEIPIPVMNESFPIIADTTAMGDPVEIRYELTFYEDTIADEGQIPQVAAGNVLIIAVIILGAGGVLNLIVKKKRAG